MILVAGHYCHDTLVNHEGVHRVLGGSAAYISAMLTALLAPHRVVAKVGSDFRYAAKVAHAPLVVPGARTTSFVDDYTHGERRETLEAACAPIAPDELGGPATVAIACAVAGEVPLETLLRLRELSGVLLCDAQGLLRAVSADGAVSLRPLAETPFCEAPLDYLKASRAEATLLDLERLRRRCTVLVTEGADGCTVVTRDARTHVAPFPATERDATGAGDCFLAGFAAGLLRGWDPLRAARLGNFCGARAVEQVGVPGLAPRELLHFFNS